MNRIYLSRRIGVAISFLFLLIGFAIYLLFRPTSLLMFHWLDVLRLSSWILIFRETFRYLPMPDWMIYNLPFALWMLSSMILIDSIWADSKSNWRYIYIWIIPTIALGSEFFQFLGWIPGTFDLDDVLILLFCAIFFIRRNI
ncbi:hypothetical protein EHQ12_08540 [Leptospira gomenensis]|uniref:Uncharacterized protein n=1 Tax=Leptospira gomenensis TaxID=2484974 RepID=A0A5F1YDN5_9LEPT|nr:hypothetical protein [Leptospira gomenensis]TGK35899.1 hypothetical protein EHQ17_04750 [Leptospira gomenensis]TGK40069.1 hypothetical protein EHQ12_08540 [Leptospira gomenensis]TGK51519.1 hypothetical protein EHQ07_02935 [Leptospira gomenensis]TGK68076.1 hypothetical protein EHQ13_01465 [Leptospira gomenensis]